MGLMTDFFAMLFGSNRNVLVETAEVFRENAENASAREAAAQSAALHQFAAEFRHARRGWFDRFIDQDVAVATKKHGKEICHQAHAAVLSACCAAVRW